VNAAGNRPYEASETIAVSRAAPKPASSPSDALPSGADSFAELSELGTRLEGALSSSPSAVGLSQLAPQQWAWDPGSDALSVAGDISDFFGWSSDDPQLSGRRWLDRMHPDDRGRHGEALVAHLDGLTDRFECASRMLGADGTYVWVFASGVALRNGVGRAQKVIGRVRPLSSDTGLGEGGSLEGVLGDVWLSGVAALEERERERAIRLQAEAANRSQREFLATVSHEIRNPLSVIFAYSSLLNEAAEEQGDPSLKQRLGKIERAGKQLLDLINGVLDLSKVEAGKAELAVQEFDLDELLLEVEEMGMALSERGGNRFRLEAAADLGRMRSDRTKLRQILLNLVGNAAKFTDGGEIALRVAPDPARPEHLAFAVADTGIGIPADKLGRLFKAFSQADAAVARQRGGTGLGLFICERYCRLLGGTISVESREGEGSTFEVVLPRALAEARDAAEPARAGRSLVIGHTEEVSSLDPHFVMRNTNFMLAQHVFDRLVHRDAAGRLAPGLATSWEPMGESGWRFRLRQGVRFHDGSPFDVEDVLATFRRLPRIEGSNVPYATLIKPVVGIATSDPFTLELFTGEPHPLLPIDLANIAIINRRHAESPTQAFDALEAAIGTGPFRVRRWCRQEAIQLDGFEDHWAGPPDWDSVTFRLIEDEVASVSALVRGEVDLIDNVAPSQLAELGRDPAVQLSGCVTNRLWYLHLDQFRDQSPFVFDRKGTPLPRNPLKDPRVRQAISLGIDRAFLTQKLMLGQALPAGDVAPPGVFGANPALTAPAYDPVAAKALLAEAGYPDGFALTLHGSRDRSFHGARVCRAIALMLNGIGIACRPEALPSNEFYARAARREFSAGLGGWGSITGETSYTLRMLLAGRDEARGFGMANRGGYANAVFDALLAEAVRTLDDARRERLLQQATAVALGETAIVPVCHRISTWATRRGLRYQPQADGSTQAGWASLEPARA
jgi:peptide/nickel transport system substrate-binding protein